MNDPVDALILDLLEWIAKEERSYTDVMEAWRTSCPRLPVWEEANDRGFVTRQHRQGEAIVGLTSSGHAFLSRHKRKSRSVIVKAL
jgi:hypothetical protein